MEVFFEIPSDRVSFDERPWMKSAEITDKLIEAIKSGEYEFIRANFPNGDMVGHTGNFTATQIAVEAVDLCLSRIIKAVNETNVVLVITADHGNADEMYEKSKSEIPKAKTAHTLNPVPFIIYDIKESHELKNGDFGLANVVPTIVGLLGIEKPSCWKESMIM